MAIVRRLLPFVLLLVGVALISLGLARALGITPHVAQKVTGSAIDDRTTRHAGYAISQRKRKLIEQVFGWMKTVGVMRKTRHRGRSLVEWFFVLTAAAYNLIRIPKLLAAG